MMVFGLASRQGGPTTLRRLFSYGVRNRLHRFDGICALVQYDLFQEKSPFQPD
jgi:hypothetical protein